MRLNVLALLLAASLPAAALADQATTPGAVPAAVTAAVNDPARQADAVNDSRRKITELATFAGVQPGQRVVDLIPGSGYFTRVFSQIVGPKGRVFAVWPTEYAKEAESDVKGSRALAADPHYNNVVVLVQPAAAVSLPEKADVVFTSQNYHDYPDPFMGKVDLARFDKQVFDALKPGGTFVVIDHVAEAGSGLRDTNTLHRIDPAIVRKQVEAAGFVFDGESNVLRNPADDHTLKVFDPKIRGKTDQFVYRFRKPK
ncbi:putative methyltransferase [Luteibacter sp. Sphag1AF]|uniref:class I SAM-dependent methyltransferase n=1 Tax=Luteibacter sp. Sphag1AF TaxID=2587031 RepID=UPI001612E239|nr:class I SAM-dependent methyltransferase [Luteibacter sp. Sphag1AF]MBB3226504.1 putative methyltransferase [Luteibacter sp. Sphag1AF]